MRGDRLGRKWRAIRANEANPKGLTVTEFAQREETGIRTIYRDLEAPQAGGFPLYTEQVERASRWAFIDTSKFKIPAIISRKAAEPAKQTFSNFSSLHHKFVSTLYAFFLGKIKILAFFAPWREIRLST
jgi:hypothetical protein